MSCVAHYEQPAPRLLRTSPILWTLTNTNVSAIRVNILSNSRKLATPYQQWTYPGLVDTFPSRGIPFS